MSVSGDWLVLGVLEREQDLNGDGDTRHARSGFQSLFLGGFMEKGYHGEAVHGPMMFPDGAR